MGSVVRIGVPPVVGLHMSILQSTPPPPPAVGRCNADTFPWWPYSDSKDFRRNAALILIILFSLLLCVLAFLSAIRYLLRHSRHNEQAAGVVGQQLPAAINIMEDPKEAVHSTTDTYRKGMKLAGMEAECTICLLEFVEGDGIKVLGRCDHGFHVQCIQQWLNSSHSTCPTCRSNCLLQLSSSAPAPAPHSITPVPPSSQMHPARVIEK